MGNLEEVGEQDGETFLPLFPEIPWFKLKKVPEKARDTI